MKSMFLLAGVALAFATPAAAQQLVTNGGFETGTLSGFTQSGNTGYTGITSAYAASGSFAAGFGAIGSVGGISQTLATTAGQNYLISFDLASGGAGPNLYSVMFGGMSLFSGTNVAPFNFTNFSTTATATGASTELSFSFRNDPSYFYLDNISVTAVNSAVPEPATWALMLMGFGGMGVAMRRRRSNEVRAQLA